MVANAQAIHRLTLMVARLMDADLLPLAEGNALLAAIQALTQTPEETATVVRSMQHRADNPPR